MPRKKKRKPPQEIARYFEASVDGQRAIQEQSKKDWQKICITFPDPDESYTGLVCSLYWGNILWEEIQMPVSEYRIALERQLARLQAGAVISGYDSTTIGDKNTECSGGLCWNSVELWGGLLAARFLPAEGPRNGSQRIRYLPLPCPLDHREKPSVSGCFYHCRFFNPKKGKTPVTAPEAIPLYETALAHMDAPEGVWSHNGEPVDPIWSAGYEAYESGLSLDACPHPSGTNEADRWMNGWNEAKELPF